VRRVSNDFVVLPLYGDELFTLRSMIRSLLFTQFVPRNENMSVLPSFGINIVFALHITFLFIAPLSETHACWVQYVS
jgi:hypothetical protein